jgi:hypothetical protein
VTTSPASSPLGTWRVLGTGLLLAAGGMALVGLVHTFVVVSGREGGLIDFGPLYTAAATLLRGESPYPQLAYPPLPAIVTVPLALVPLEVAEVLVMLVLVAGVPVTLRLLGVRDWRCYVVAFLWTPVLSAIQTGNITILLGLGAALAWRYRERAHVPALVVGVTLAAKFFLWPLAVWLAATGRRRAGAESLAAGALILLASWAAIGFSGVRDYGDVAERVRMTVERDAYTVYALALDLGASPTLARALWLALAAALVAGIVVLGRRGDDRGAFVLAVAAALAAWPLVWLHSFELLLVAVAVAQPRLALAWLVPVAMVLSTGSGNGTPPETAFALAATGLTVAVALRPWPARSYGATGGRTTTASSSLR